MDRIEHTGGACDDPLSKVLGLDAGTSGIGAWFGFTSGSTALLVAFMAIASAVALMHARAALTSPATTAEIEVVKEEAPPPPPSPPAPEPDKPEPAQSPARAMTRHEASPPPAPAPARAAKVLTQEPDPREPVDLTGNTIVQGNADAFAGGFTMAGGNSAAAVRAMPAPTGVGGGTGPAQAPPPSGPSLSRRASPASHDWNAPFPQEADSAQIDDARVTLEIEVRPDGSAAAVRIVQDPGNGFGREARRYAFSQRYVPALDRDGNPVSSKLLVPVHFSR
jgi:protein TonB